MLDSFGAQGYKHCISFWRTSTNRVPWFGQLTYKTLDERQVEGETWGLDGSRMDEVQSMVFPIQFLMIMSMAFALLVGEVFLTHSGSFPCSEFLSQLWVSRTWDILQRFCKSAHGCVVCTEGKSVICAVCKFCVLLCTREGPDNRLANTPRVPNSPSAHPTAKPSASNELAAPLME